MFILFIRFCIIVAIYCHSGFLCWITRFIWHSVTMSCMSAVILLWNYEVLCRYTSWIQSYIGQKQSSKQREVLTLDIFSCQSHPLPEFNSVPAVTSDVQVTIACDAVLNAPSAYKKQEPESWEEEIQVSKHARSLRQLDNGVRIPPR